jgi:hypothetical protein
MPDSTTPFQEHAAARVASRRALVDEGRVLLTYLMAQPPPAGALKRYVLGVLATEEFRPLRLPAWVRSHPSLLRVLDPPLGRAHLLRQRLYLASLVAEATPVGSRLVYDYGGCGRVSALSRLIGLGMIEVAFFGPRLLGARLWQP